MFHPVSKVGAPVKLGIRSALMAPKPKPLPSSWLISEISVPGEEAIVVTPPPVDWSQKPRVRVSAEAGLARRLANNNNNDRFDIG